MTASELTFLQEDIAKEMAAVLDNLKKKYLDSLPALQSEREMIVRSLDDMKDSLGSRLDTIEKDLDEEEVNAAIDEMKQLRVQSSRLRSCRDLLEKFSILEGAIVELSTTLEINTKKSAELLKSAREELPALSELKEATMEGIDETPLTICKIFTKELDDSNNMLIGKLHSWFKKVFSFPSSRVQNISQMIVSASGEDTNNNFAAMHNLNLLKGWFNQLATSIMSNLIDPIINGGGTSIVSCTTDPVDPLTFIFRVKTVKGKRSAKDINVTEVFRQLESIFVHLNDSLSDAHIAQNVSVVSNIMVALREQLQMAILKKVISPLSSSEEEIEGVMVEAEKFRDMLIDLRLFNVLTPTFKKFADDHEKVFTDRKCISQLARARELIQMPYVDLTTVGYGEEEEEETDQFNQDCLNALGISADEAMHSEDSSYPHFFRLLRCQISVSTKELADLIQDMVLQASAAESEETAGRLLLTARNIVQLFLSLAPKYHNTTLSSVPQMAAVYYNNCHLIAHRLMVLVFDVVASNKPILTDSLRAFLADYLIQLRESARCVMEMQLMQIRRNLSTLLSDSSISDIRSMKDGATKCTMQIESVANVWKEVLPELVYCRAMSNIIGFVLDELAIILLKAEDITATDASLISQIFSQTLMPIEKLVVIRGTPMLHKECAHEYFHFKEIIFMLNASLQDIDDRWCEGKGPLAVHLNVVEIRHLVKALFSNSEQRKRLLDRIY